MSLALSRYTPERATALAQQRQERRNEEDTALIFRDIDGIYWTIDSQGPGWQRHDGLGWARAPAAPDGALEGPAGLGTETESPLLRQLGARAPVADVSAFVARAVRDARILYQDGAVDSEQAAALAMERMLVDRDARIWTTGFHSGRWYAWSSGSWDHMEGGPDADSLVGESVLRDDPVAHADLLEQLELFRETGDYLPEAVAAAWTPPAPPGSAAP